MTYSDLHGEILSYRRMTGPIPERLVPYLPYTDEIRTRIVSTMPSDDEDVIMINWHVREKKNNKKETRATDSTTFTR